MPAQRSLGQSCSVGCGVMQWPLPLGTGFRKNGEYAGLRPARPFRMVILWRENCRKLLAAGSLEGHL